MNFSRLLLYMEDLQSALPGKYFRALVDAFYYCHSHSVLHRDVRAEKLFLWTNGMMEVTSFRFSVIINQGDSVRKKIVGECITARGSGTEHVPSMAVTVQKRMLFD